MKEPMGPRLSDLNISLFWTLGLGVGGGLEACCAVSTVSVEWSKFFSNINLF